MANKVSTAVTGLVGEELVLLQLALRCVGTDWQAFRSITENGCDIELIHRQTNKRINVEVKTRQRLVSKHSAKDSVHFSATGQECESLDVMVCFFVDTNTIFVVPRADLRHGEVKGRPHASYYLKLDKQGRPRDIEQYKDAWHLVHPDLTE